jgi:tRNA G18 (ribose-2'-O)-methylase SpoU
MNSKGFFGIGIEHAKTEFNYWTLFRTAQILNANFLFIIGARYKPHAADVLKSYRHIPVYSYINFQDFNDHRPFDCKLIGVEMTENAIEISQYKHPDKAIYLLGAEDHGLTKQALNSCQDIIKLRGERSMNVSVAGSIILYDRITKE